MKFEAEIGLTNNEYKARISGRGNIIEVHQFLGAPVLSCSKTKKKTALDTLPLTLLESTNLVFHMKTFAFSKLYHAIITVCFALNEPDLIFKYCSS